jgi:tRNA 2-thiouridine synthesizing protein A
VIRLDLRGMRCPWPALRLARALREGADTVEVLADDPRAPEELAAVAAGVGAHFIAADGAFHVTRAAPVNPSFTA